MVICPDCGKEVPKGKFCKNCGAYLADIEDETVESVDLTPVSDNIESVSEDNTFKFCFNCGSQIEGDFKYCPKCGQDLTANIVKSNGSPVVLKEKNTLLAIILSVILPGLGQIYLGLDNKGAILLIAYVISVILILLAIGLIFVVILWIWALVDTIISVNAINRGEEVEDKLF